MNTKHEKAGHLSRTAALEAAIESHRTSARALEDAIADGLAFGLPDDLIDLAPLAEDAAESLAILEAGLEIMGANKADAAGVPIEEQIEAVRRAMGERHEQGPGPSAEQSKESTLNRRGRRRAMGRAMKGGGGP